MDPHYYKEYFQIEREHWWFRARSEILRRYIRAQIFHEKPLRILNVGAATGATSMMLREFGEVTSIEFDQDTVDFMEGRLPVEIEQGSILHLAYADGFFDFICAFDVLEHIEEDSAAASELRRVCKPGGSVLVTVPALMSLWGEHDEINHHHRRYEKSAFAALFKESEGRVAYLSYFNSVLFPPVFFVRKAANLFGKRKEKLRSDFEKFKAGFADPALFRIFRAESRLLGRQIPLPVGVSLILHWKKND